MSDPTYGTCVDTLAWASWLACPRLPGWQVSLPRPGIRPSGVSRTQCLHFPPSPNATMHGVCLQNSGMGAGNP